MPIKHLTETSLVKVCALCQSEVTIPLTSIVLGQDTGGGDPDLINLPPCTTPNCGAVEILKRTWDQAPEAYRETAFFQQRAAVNALAQRLRAMGQSTPGCQTIHAEETEEPPQCVSVEAVRSGHTPKMPDNQKGAQIWAQRQSGGDIHPSKRRG